MSDDRKLTYGWGINDADYKVTKYSIVDGKYKQVWVCPYYEDWRGILERCLCPNFQKNWTSYLGCSIVVEWKYLSNFIKWVDSQPNRNWQNCVLDKDLLIRNNKIYSPDTAIYIPNKLNCFITDSKKSRGQLMIGVTTNKLDKNKPYLSQCNNPFGQGGKNLGYYRTELEAHKAWQAKKHEYACQLADLQQDPRVAKVLRERYAPDKDWTTC
jgi:hypothetical protein